MQASRPTAKTRGVIVAATLIPVLILEPGAPGMAVEAQSVQKQHDANLASELSQAQTFQAAASGPFSQVGLAVGRRAVTPSTASISVQVRTAPDGQPASTGAPGTLLAETTLTASAVPVVGPGATPLTSVAFSPAPLITAGVTYAIVLTSTSPQLDNHDRPAAFRVGVERRRSSPVSSGFFSADHGASWYRQDFSFVLETSIPVQLSARLPSTPGSGGAPGASRAGVASTSDGLPRSSAAVSADPVIAAAGDIACDPADPNYNGGAGVPGVYCRMGATSNVMVGATLAAVLPLGDEQYEDATLAKFQQSYDPTWGRVKLSTRPTTGNHEYKTAGASGYFAYFGSVAGNPANGYYSFDVGSWHLIAFERELCILGLGRQRMRGGLTSGAVAAGRSGGASNWLYSGLLA
jgi:hypothetical protein